eukprot:862493-Prymnesium_polylepis.1
MHNMTCTCTCHMRMHMSCTCVRWMRRVRCNKCRRAAMSARAFKEGGGQRGGCGRGGVAPCCRPR